MLKKNNKVFFYLVFGFQHQQVGDVAERQAEADDLGLCDVDGELAYVQDPGRHVGTPQVTFELLAVIAIGYKIKKEKHLKGKGDFCEIEIK